MTTTPMNSGADFDTLFRQYAGPLRRYIRTVSQAVEADDLVQETFVRALEYLDLSRMGIRTWLFTVAHNLTIDALRKSDANTVSITELSEDQHPIAHDPSEQLFDQQVVVVQVLKKMSQRRQQVFYLRSCGLTYKEIAVQLNAKESMVNNDLDFIRRKIRSVEQRSA